MNKEEIEEEKEEEKEEGMDYAESKGGAETQRRVFLGIDRPFKRSSKHTRKEHFILKAATIKMFELHFGRFLE